MLSSTSLPYFSLPTVLSDNTDSPHDPHTPLLSNNLTSGSPRPCGAGVNHDYDPSINDDNIEEADEFVNNNRNVIAQHPPDYATYEHPLPECYPSPLPLHASPHGCISAHHAAASEQCSSCGEYSLGRPFSDLNNHDGHIHHLSYAHDFPPVSTGYCPVRQLEQPHGGHAYHAVAAYQHYQRDYSDHHHDSRTHMHEPYSSEPYYCHHLPRSPVDSLPSSLQADVNTPVQSSSRTKSLRFTLKSAVIKVKNSLTMTASKVFNFPIHFKRQKSLQGYKELYLCDECAYLGYHDEQYTRFDEYGRGHSQAYRGIPWPEPQYDALYSTSHYDDYDSYDNIAAGGGSDIFGGYCDHYACHHPYHSYRPLAPPPPPTITTMTGIGGEGGVRRTRKGKELCECKPCMKALAIKIIKNSRSGKRKYKRRISIKYRSVASLKISRLNALSSY